MAFKYKGLRLKNPSLMKRLRRVTGITFTRNSVAYDYYGKPIPANTPRFGFGGIDGVLIEEAHTNLLTANQSTGTDSTGNTTGFNITTANDVISSSSDYSIQGSKSLKVVTGNITGGNTEGFWTPTSITVSANTSHTASLWVKGSGTVALSLIERNADDALIGQTYSSNVTLTDQWQLVTVTRAFGDTGVKARIAVRTVSQQAATFYVDMLQLTATAYPLSWTLGGTTQAAETLSAPSNTLNLTSGSIELEITPGQSGGTCFIFQMTPETGKNHIDTYLIAKKIYYRTIDKDGNASTITGSTLTSNTNYVIGMAWGVEKLTGYLSGAIDGSPVTNPKLPTTKYTDGVNIGSNSSNTLQFNGYVKNLIITAYMRDDSSMIQRAKQNSNGRGSVVDKKVSLVFPLKNDLRAYRVVTV